MPEWLALIGQAAGILQDGERAHYAGADDSRGVAYFVVVPLG